MTNIILKTSALIGTTINFTYHYPIYLKNRLNSNIVIQLKSITVSIFLLFISYSYLAITNKNVFFKAIFFIDSICFLFLCIAFLGLLLYKIKPNHTFNLRNFTNNETKFYSEPSLFLSIDKMKTDNYSKIKNLSSFFKNKTTYQNLLELLNENNFQHKNKKLKPIEVNTLIYKLEKLNLFKYGFIQKELIISAQKTFDTYYGVDNYSKLKGRFENEHFSIADKERYDNLKYLDVLIEDKI